MNLYGQNFTDSESGTYSINKRKSIIKLNFYNGESDEIPYTFENGEFIFHGILEDGNRYVKQ